MKIEYRPIGIVHSPFTDIAAMPIQATRARDVTGTVEVFPEYRDGLKDLDGFSHIILLYHFHKVTRCHLQVVPFLDTESRGLFATRAPARPNPIGLSVLRLLGVEGGRLSVSDVDILNGTPVLDIKPFVPEFDHRLDTRVGWIGASASNKGEVVSDDRFR